jgi:hypothetical protein
VRLLTHHSGGDPCHSITGPRRPLSAPILVWIPMKPDAYSKGKPDTRSDFIPVSVPN